MIVFYSTVFKRTVHQQKRVTQRARNRFAGYRRLLNKDTSRRLPTCESKKEKLSRPPRCSGRPRRRRGGRRACRRACRPACRPCRRRRPALVLELLLLGHLVALEPRERALDRLLGLGL